jgi:hypothetical protein
MGESGTGVLRSADNTPDDREASNGDGRVEEPIIYRYVGGGWIPDIPARDLAKPDLEPLGWQLRTHLRTSGLYELVGSDSFTRADKAEAKAAAEAEAKTEE